jgi:hypothetical protein
VCVQETVLKTLSQDTSAQQRKGVHARHQLELWEATLESRIRLQVRDRSSFGSPLVVADSDRVAESAWTCQPSTTAR